MKSKLAIFMTKREVYAGQAMAGIIGNLHNYSFPAKNGKTLYQRIADRSFEIADAMIAERDKQ